jgi:predicted DCC family thiol-disulfide oxidoreductase YuxK
MEAYLLYDADCGVCTFAKRVVTAFDWRRRIEAVPLQDPRTDRLLAGMEEDARWATFHVVRGGRTASGGAGLIQIGGLLLNDRVPTLAAEIPILRRASDRIYAFIAGLRGAIQCEV